MLHQTANLNSNSIITEITVKLKLQDSNVKIKRLKFDLNQSLIFKYKIAKVYKIQDERFRVYM